MGAVLVIAIFYSHALACSALGAAALIVLVLIGLNAMEVCRLWPYLLAGFVLWFFVHESGVYATVAGVALALTIPMHTRINAVEFPRGARALLDRFDRTERGDFLVLTSKGQQEALLALEHATEAVSAPILRLEHARHNFSALVVMPLFASPMQALRSAATGKLRSHCWSPPRACHWQTARRHLGSPWRSQIRNCSTSSRLRVGISARLRLPGRDRFYHVAVCRYACIR
jgi:hypothetical protein